MSAPRHERTATYNTAHIYIGSGRRASEGIDAISYIMHRPVYTDIYIYRYAQQPARRADSRRRADCLSLRGGGVVIYVIIGVCVYKISTMLVYIYKRRPGYGKKKKIYCKEQWAKAWPRYVYREQQWRICARDTYNMRRGFFAGGSRWAAVARSRACVCIYTRRQAGRWALMRGAESAVDAEARCVRMVARCREKWSLFVYKWIRRQSSSALCI